MTLSRIGPSAASAKPKKYELHTHDGRDHGSRCGVLDQARERGLRSLGNAGVVDAAGML